MVIACEALIDRTQGLAGNCYGMAAFPLLDLHHGLVFKQHQGNSLRIAHRLAAHAAGTECIALALDMGR